MKVGIGAMLETLRGWANTHRYGSGQTSEFIELAEQASGQPLGPLFNHWLFEAGKPRIP
jgi:aminopeptidase N